jgi:hypothetical protein
LATFSASTRWRSWCHCILVRSAAIPGISFMDIAPLSLVPDALPAGWAEFAVCMVNSRLRKAPTSGETFVVDRFQIDQAHFRHQSCVNHPSV